MRRIDVGAASTRRNKSMETLRNLRARAGKKRGMSFGDSLIEVLRRTVGQVAELVAPDRRSDSDEI